jgi:hypothetical protein
MWALGESGAVVLPPHSCWALQLMSGILGLQHFRHPQNTKLVFHCIYPLFYIQRFGGFLENWWTSVHEILKTAILIDLMSALVSPMAGIIRNIA